MTIPNILIVDDNPFNVRLLTDIFQDEGFSTDSVSNGSVVMEAVRKSKPDIILLDIMMPGLDGFQVCTLLKGDSEACDIPIIMVTAKTDSSDVKKALETGAFDYIKKPIDEVEAIARVKSALRYKQQQDKLREMATRDSLTGLFNHALLIELFEKEMAKHQRTDKGISFVMIDIDYFKRVNDTYGHQTGDDVLRELGKLLTSSLRKGDIIGRYGGEEFGIVLPETSEENALILCERLRKYVETQPIFTDNGPVSITVSIGLAAKEPGRQITSTEMIKWADDALYQAKQNGRNKVQLIKAM